MDSPEEKKMEISQAHFFSILEMIWRYADGHYIGSPEDVVERFLDSVYMPEEMWDWAWAWIEYRRIP